MTPFDAWLRDNWGFEADGTPVLHRPPVFVGEDGEFDVGWYEKWLEERRIFWEEYVNHNQ